MKIELILGDITTMQIDAIVNAANSSLMGGGGVDGAIHRAGGPQILKECKMIRARQGACEVGQAVITSGGELPAKFVIHTVGPIWRQGDPKQAEMLKNCYFNSLKLASENGLRTIAFPNISTGVYGYPLREAAEIAIKAVSGSEFPGIDKVIFVCFNQENYDLYQELLG